MGVGHPQILGPLVHPAHEGVHIPGADTGQGHRRVVPRGEEQAVEEGFQGQGLPRHQVEGGPLDPRPFPLDLYLAGEVSPKYSAATRAVMSFVVLAMARGVFSSLA